MSQEILERYLEQGYTLILKRLANGRYSVTRRGKGANPDIEGRRDGLWDAVKDLKREIRKAKQFDVTYIPDPTRPGQFIPVGPDADTILELRESGKANLLQADVSITGTFDPEGNE